MLETFYQDDFVRLYHGDCRVLLPQLEDADLLLTDPPYGIGVCKRGTISSRRKGSRRYRPVTWDNEPPPLWLIQMAMSKTRHQIIWGGGHIGGLPRATCWLIWDKKNDGVDFSQAEIAWTSLPRAVRLYRHLWSGFRQEHPEERFHPTQKPLALMTWCLGFARGAQTVIDPWCGSGTTLVACKRAGIRAVGIDREVGYLQAAAARLAATQPNCGPTPPILRAA